MNNLIKLAPTVLGFLGGPAGGLAGAGLQWLAAQFGAKDSTVGAIKESLQGYKPEDAIELRKIDIAFQEFCLSNNIKVDLAQIGVNNEQAKSTNWFVAGPRPYIMWVCGTGFAYATILEPVARFVAQVMFSYGGAFPEIDTQLTLQVMLGLLGLSGMRSFEKARDVEGNR
jgi:hypothetical protein